MGADIEWTKMVIRKWCGQFEVVSGVSIQLFCPERRQAKHGEAAKGWWLLYFLLGPEILHPLHPLHPTHRGVAVRSWTSPLASCARVSLEMRLIESSTRRLCTSTSSVGGTPQGPGFFGYKEVKCASSVYCLLYKHS